MKVVLDSSVLVAAFITRAGVCAGVMEDVLAHHDLVLSGYIVDELARKLTEKFEFPRVEVRAVRQFLEAAAEIVEPEQLPADCCRDPKDIPVLGTAVAAVVEILITVDKDLLALREFRGIRIAKPGEFWRIADAASPLRPG